MEVPPEEPRAVPKVWFEDVPEMAARRSVAPQKGTARYNSADRLSRTIRGLIPRYPDPAVVMNPFGALHDAELNLDLSGSRGRNPFAKAIDDFDPQDPVRAGSDAFKAVCRSIKAFGSPVTATDPSIQTCNADVAKYGVPPLGELVTKMSIEGYRVDVSALRSGRADLQVIEESLGTNDIRRKVLWALRNLVNGCLHSLVGQLSAEHEGTVFVFWFNQDDPTRYLFCHENPAAN